MLAQLSFILAEAHEPSNLVGWVSIGVSTVVGIGLFYIGAGMQTRRDEIKALSQQITAGETKRTVEVKDLSDKLHDASTKLIDERMRAISHSVNNHAQNLTTTMDKVAIRVQKSEDDIGKLGSIRAEAEMQLTKAISEFREYVSECAPTRREFDKVERTLDELSKKVGDLKVANVDRTEMKNLLEEVLKNR